MPEYKNSMFKSQNILSSKLLTTKLHVDLDGNKFETTLLAYWLHCNTTRMADGTNVGMLVRDNYPCSWLDG